MCVIFVPPEKSLPSLLNVLPGKGKLHPHTETKYDQPFPSSNRIFAQGRQGEDDQAYERDNVNVTAPRGEEEEEENIVAPLTLLRENARR